MGSELWKIVLLVVFCVLIGSLVIAAVIKWLYTFFRALAYINTEIQRTEGAEQEYWKRERRRLFKCCRK